MMRKWRNREIRSGDGRRRLLAGFGVEGLGGLVGRFSLQDDNPSEGFQDDSDGTDHGDDANIGRLPFVVGVEHVDAFEDVDDAKDEDWVSHAMVVYVPILSVFVVLLWSQEKCRHLQYSLYQIPFLFLIWSGAFSLKINFSFIYSTVSITKTHLPSTPTDQSSLEMDTHRWLV